MNEVSGTVGEITTKTTKEVENMVRRAETLKSLDELNLSARTETYLNNKFNSLDEIVFEGRLMAYELANHQKRVDTRKKSMSELANALDVAGFIRHDINEHSFAICRLYVAIFDILGMGEMPSSLEDFRNIFGGKDGTQYDEFRIGNERYESFKNPVDELGAIKRSIEISLTEEETNVVFRRFGVVDGIAHTLEEVANELNVARWQVHVIESRALRKLRRPHVKLPGVMMSLRVNEMGVAEILEELEKIRKDPILQREAELQDKLRSISKSHFAQAKEARLYYLEGVDIDQLNLSVRVYNCLRRADINTVADIIRYPKEDWLKIRNVNRKGIEEVVSKMRLAGYEDFNIDI